MQSDSTVDLPLCACDCGERVNPSDRPSRPNKFLIGHDKRATLIRCDRCKERLPRANFEPRIRNGNISGVNGYCRSCAVASVEERERVQRTEIDRANAWEETKRIREERRILQAQSSALPKPKRETPDPALCACGCGNRVNPLKPGSTRVPMYCTGHHGSRLDDYIVDAETGCWVWQKYKSRAGYGVISRSGKEKYAHRSYYADRFGPIPAGLEVDHLCFNPACVNPDHLEAVTRLVNQLRCRNHVLNRSDAERIRSMKGIVAGKTLAAEYGVSIASIYNIWAGRTWYHDIHLIY